MRDLTPLVVGCVLRFTLGGPSPVAAQGRPQVSVDDVRVVEGQSGSKSVAVTVTLSAASPTPVTVE